MDRFFHTPNKTLLLVVKLPDFSTARDKGEYKMLCTKGNLQYSQKFKQNAQDFGESVIFNDYEKFLDKVHHGILAL